MAIALLVAIALIPILGAYVAIPLFLFWYLRLYGGHGWVLTGILVGLGVGGATLAPLGDRFGRRTLIVTGCLGVREDEIRSAHPGVPTLSAMNTVELSIEITRSSAAISARPTRVKNSSLERLRRAPSVDKRRLANAARRTRLPRFRRFKGHQRDVVFCLGGSRRLILIG